MLVLLLSCNDRPGLVAAAAHAIATHGGNIVDADQHTDTQHERFLQRIEFELPSDQEEGFRSTFERISGELEMTWSLHDTSRVPKIALLVSQEAHCLYDILARIELGDLQAEVGVVISNHNTHASVAERFGVRFCHLPVDPNNREAQQAQVLSELLSAEIELVALARYMQIIPDSVLAEFPDQIINIHHSFLPAFVGAQPYHRAHARGVKIIGATAHYATSDLDEGPIICQEVTTVSHRDTVQRLIQRGRDVEQLAFAKAIRLHLERRVMSYQNRTVVFD